MDISTQLKFINNVAASRLDYIKKTHRNEKNNNTKYKVDITNNTIKATHRSSGKCGHARGKTVVLTSSPYKQELITKRQETMKASVPKSKMKVTGTNKPK